jgi:hypothetical protein
MILLNPIAQRRLEGAALLAASAGVYGYLEFSWALFAACFFLPDLSILPYLKGPKIGGATYNAAHSLLGPLLIGAWGAIAESPIGQQLALIWLAHIAHDRALGWGLKTEKSFFHTDLGTRRLPFPVPVLDRHLQ